MTRIFTLFCALRSLVVWFENSLTAPRVNGESSTRTLLIGRRKRLFIASVMEFEFPKIEP